MKNKTSGLHLGVKIISMVSLGLISVLVLGAKTEAFSGTGSGSSSDPYLISTCAQLQSIGEDENTQDRLYKLSGNIDCSATASWNSGEGFAPLPEFKGTLDGQGYTINDLVINRPSDPEVGLFSRLDDNSLVTRLTLDDVSITGSNFTGALASQADYSIIHDVHVNGTVSTSENYAGGLVGSAFGWENDSLFERSSFTGSVTSTTSAGGILGVGYNGFTLNDVYVNATITSGNVGGVIGQGAQSCGYRYINRALVKGTLNGDSHVGGIAGRYENLTCYTNDINDSVVQATFSGAGTKGNLVGQLSGSSVTFDNSYADQTASGTSSCVGNGTGDTGTCSDIGSHVAPSDEPYAQWDFSTIWQENSGTITQRATAAQTGPNAVTNLVAEAGDPSNSVDISWTAPGTLGSYPLLQYRAEVKLADDTWSTLVDSSSDTSTSLNFQDLKLGTEYDIRVAAITEYSMSPWTEISYSSPEPEEFTASTCEELDELDQQGSYLDTYYLGADIDCSGYEGFTTLNWGDDFAGMFDGQGHTISNLDISAVDSYGVGLFGYVYNAVIQNTTLVDGSVIVTEDSASCGALVGAAYDTELYNISVSGYDINCDYNVGGIAGYYESDGTDIDLALLSSDGVLQSGPNVGGLFGGIELYDETSLGIHESYSSAVVVSDNYNAGGLIGYVYTENEDDTIIPTSFILQDSYADGEVSAISNVGGLIGSADAYNDGYESVSEIEVENSYSAASAVATEDSAGGIIGYMDDLEYEGEQVILSNVFAAGSVEAANLAYGLVGSDDGIDEGELRTNNSYFDQSTTGQTEATVYDVPGWVAVNDDGLEGDYFKDNSDNAPFSDGDTPIWDFESVWSIRENNFPCLQAIVASCNAVMPHDAAEVVSSENGSLVSIEQTGCSAVDTFTSQREVTLHTKDAAYDYPAGLINFELSGCNIGVATVSLNFMGTYDSSKTIVRKYNANTGIFTTLSNGYEDMSVSSTTVEGQPAYRITYNINDGSDLDQDGQVNGRIVDPIGIAQAVVGSPNTGLGRQQ